MLVNPLNSLPWVFTGLLESWISINRIEAFLDSNANEDMLKDQQTIDQERTNENESENILEFDDVVCEHKMDGFKFLLGPIDLKLRRGEFLGVIGSVGSGKSSFLNAILNEISLKTEGFLKSGKIKFNLNNKKGIGFISQDSWIQCGTIKENILFGKAFEYRFYNEVIDACDLRHDFEMFNDYDNTLISDRGLSLSGGQKCRLALARAIYQSFDLYLIDDLFNSLDLHVATNIYENCIIGKLLANKTRVVCTNQYEFLKNADRIMVLENGCIKKIGSPEEILNEYSRNQLSSKLIKDSYNGQQAKPSNLDQINSEEFKEEFNEGTVKLSVYSVYAKAVSIPLCISIIAFITMMQSSKTTSDYWLSYWTNKLKVDVDIDSFYYLKILLIIALTNSLLASFRAILFAIGCIHSAKNLYNQLFKTVLQSKLSFFNRRALGQILNRFSNDVFHIDENLPFTLNIFLANLISVIAAIFVTGYNVPICLIVLILLCYPYYLIQYLYRQASMVLKRISTNTLSPLYSQFYETLLGLSTIRAYRASKRYVHAVRII